MKYRLVYTQRAIKDIRKLEENPLKYASNLLKTLIPKTPGQVLLVTRHLSLAFLAFFHETHETDETRQIHLRFRIQEHCLYFLTTAGLDTTMEF